MSTAIIKLRNLKTGIEYPIPEDQYAKMAEHHKLKFTIVGRLAPIAVKESKQFEPDVVKQAVARIMDQSGQKADQA